MKAPKITRNRTWSAMDVREFCIRHELYTRGDNRAYSHMLDMIDKMKPTDTNLYKVAEDIVNHSNPELIGDGIEANTAIMFLLEKEVVNVFFSVEER